MSLWNYTLDTLLWNVSMDQLTFNILLFFFTTILTLFNLPAFTIRKLTFVSLMAFCLKVACVFLF